MSGMTFDEDAAQALERMYSTPDVVAQRAHVLRALDPRPEQHVLDVGVGPGLLARDLAAIVGPKGRVAGVDASEAMVAMTRRRCAGDTPTDFRVADACALPFEGASFDAVVSTQVYEYVPDVGSALAEVARVLRPGGRAVVLDTDWDSLVWHSEDRARMRRVLEAWDAHLHDPHLPASLAPRLERAGLRVQRCEVVPILNRSLHPHAFSDGILAAIQAFVVARGGVPREEAEAWAGELRERDARGEYFFSLNRYLFSAVKLADG